MKRFELESSMFEGKVVFCFDDQTERLSIVDMSGANLSEGQWRGIWENLPATPQMLDRVKGKTGVITEILDSITFEMFWNRYNDKARSSKVKTERVWNKMSVRERCKAYNYIGKYEASIPYGVCKKYATTYLNDQLWNN